MSDKKPWRQQLRDKGFSYWAWIVFLTITGVLAGQLIGQRDLWREIRYKIYRFQTTALTPHHPADLPLTFVLIRDDQYWSGPLARRSPIKRDYLADLIRAVDRADPAVIAVDFDLRSPIADGSLIENPDYWAERTKLVLAIKDVATRRPLVIPKTVAYAKGTGGDVVKAESDILGSDLAGVKNIFPGYIRFAPDLRIIPARLTVEGRSEPLDSFAFAILHASTLRTYEQVVAEEAKAGSGEGFVFRFGNFLNEDAFKSNSYSAKDVLAGDPEVLKNLSHQIVLLGGSWHKDGFGAGELIDEHVTPAGRILGVYTHANYAEALRTGHYYPQISELWVVAFEVIVVLSASILLALDVSKSLKIVLTVLPSTLILVLSYFLLQNLGIFFEFIIPLVVLVAHELIHHLEWRKEVET